MNNLEQLPNIRKVLAKKLKQTGISTLEDLQIIGSERAFIRIKAIDSGACFSMLCALEGIVKQK